MRCMLGLLLGLLMSSHASAEALTIGYQPAADYLPIYVAQQRGMFARHGIEARLQAVPNGGQVPAALISGSIAIGTLTAVLLLQAASQGLPIACIAGGTVLSQGVRVGAAVVRPGVALRSARDFAGHLVGVSAIGSFLQVLFARWLDDHGADPNTVRYVEAPFTQLGDILKTGRIDAALLVEPFAMRAMQLEPGNVALPYLQDFPPGTLVNAYCVERGWAEAHAATIAAFRVAMIEAVTAIQSDPDAARRDISTWLKLPPELVAGLPMPAFDLRLDAAQITTWNVMSLHQKLLDHLVDAADVVVP